ncbi:MAG: D-aminoacyl-tRNA deacylase [Thermoplasmatales archaeon]
MKIACGEDDIAGKNICGVLEDNFSIQTFHLNTHPVFCDYLEREIKADKGELIVIPSQHKSTSNVRSLTVHPAGNFSTNSLGGFKWKMSPYDPKFARAVLLNMNKYGGDLGYQITYEATHHGPYSENPIVFVEIGSTDVEYRDRDAAYIVARSIYEAFDEDAEVYCGIGGLHYSGKFTSFALSKNVALGHIASKYRFPEISEAVLEEMIVKSPGSAGFIIEEKSFNSEQRKSLTKMMESKGYEYKLV